MNAISYALLQVRMRIPPQVLKLVFNRTRINNVLYTDMSKDLPIAITGEIRRQVIDTVILPLINCAGAVTDEIPLWGLPFEQPVQHQRIYTIPKDLTNGRTITSVLAVIWGRAGASAMNPYAAYGSSALGSCGVSPVTMAARSAANSFAPMPVTQTTDCTIIGENTFLVDGWQPIPGEFFARVMLGHDEALSNINPRSYPRFADMVVAATKAFIYNNYYIELGAGELVAGMQLGQIKDIVDSYQDQQQILDDLYRNVWGKVAHLSDTGRKHRHLGMLLGGRQ